jgi:hypothetical protein
VANHLETLFGTALTYELTRANISVESMRLSAIVGTAVGQYLSYFNALWDIWVTVRHHLSEESSLRKKDIDVFNVVRV